eukprot:CAMPEP_0119557204 /NCGR_PEP_ID=MMETSP1352-20130426/8935_1 /TAXON_ID=265584 /ORGANISM="Stauroneis constricta, Strain CCMP1120" /LENGTH=320 /DNA_ID=CAMNT_0007604271 /DNA_START=120 /DNA_END=1082 /DNA_ORIENTATION=+
MIFNQVTLIISLVIARASAFSIPASNHALPSSRVTTTTTTALNVGMTYSNDQGPGGEGDPFMMTQMAMECADSETCSLEDAQKYLEGLIHIQSDCAAGILIGDDALCEDVDDTAALVATLREKIQLGQDQLVRKTAMNSVLSVGFIAASILAMITFSAPTDATPFTLQEWWWAARDGYLSTMIVQYLQHGGLAPLDGGASIASESTVIPFTTQEWVWAVQGGYLDTMFAYYAKHGGLEASADDAALLGTTSNLTPQEIWWAMKGSYLDTLVAHVYHNGGLATSLDYDHETMPFSREEWKLAMRDGYMNNMMSHYFKNGGL